MKNIKKILLIGPLPDPITGESLANKTLLDNISKYRPNYHVDFIDMSYHKLNDLGKFSFHKMLFFVGLYRKIFKISSHDIIYMTCGQTFFGVVKYLPFICMSRIFNKQSIVHIHGNYLHQQYQDATGWKQKIMHFTLSKLDKGIVLSGSLRKNLSPFIADENIHELYNFVENNLLGSEVKFEIGQLRILYLSNLIESKGIFDLLEAACILKAKNVDFSLDIAGKLDEENSSKFKEYQGKLGDNLKFHAIVRGQEKQQLFCDSNIFVFPTFYHIEGQPIAILEAMATANIVLTTKHAGIPDIFEEGENGYYVKKNSPQSIADKLIELADNLSAQKNMVIESQRNTLKKYTVENFVNNMVDIIEDEKYNANRG